MGKRTVLGRPRFLPPATTTDWTFSLSSSSTYPPGRTIASSSSVPTLLDLLEVVVDAAFAVKPDFFVILAFFFFEAELQCS
jgi:hypothetical protein